MTNRTSKIARDTARTVAVSVISTGLAIITGVIVAKTLGPLGKGVFSSVQLVQGGVAAGTAGAGAAITYFLAKQGRSVGSLMGALSALLVIISLISWCLLGLWGLKFGFTTAVYIVALVVPASIVISWQGYYYIGTDNVRKLNLQTMRMAIALLLSVVILVAILHLGIAGLLAGWCICIYALAGVVVGDAIKTAQGLQRLNFGSDFKVLVRFGSRSALDGLMGFLNYRIDSIILLGFLGIAGFGIYSIAVSAGEMLFVVSRALSTAVSHDISILGFNASAAMAAKASRSVTFAMLVLSIPLLALAPLLIHLLYGARFLPAASALRILLPGVILVASGGPIGSFFAYQLGRPIIMVYFLLASIILQAGLCLVLVPKLGLNGAAIASSGTYLAGAAMRTIYFCRITKLSPFALWIAHSSDLATFKNLVKSLVQSFGLSVNEPLP